MIVRFATLAGSALVLAACGGSEAEITPSEGGDAQGEIRGGTISDDMLATDQVQSQSPSLKPSTEEGSDSGTGASGEPAPAGSGEPEEATEAATEEDPAEEG